MVARTGLALDRLVKRATMITDFTCVLCEAAEESHSHLFFDCPFFGGVWLGLLSQSVLSRAPMGLDRELNWFVQYCCQASVYNNLLKLVFGEKGIQGFLRLEKVMGR